MCIIQDPLHGPVQLVQFTHFQATVHAFLLMPDNDATLTGDVLVLADDDMSRDLARQLPSDRAVSLFNGRSFSMLFVPSSP